MLDIQALKSTLDIVAILKARGVKLVKKGASYVGLCPFHKESTPSFSVTPQTGLWHCFGCDAGGDVFSFVMKQEGITFFEAVKKLCRRDIQEKDLETLNREREAQQAITPIDRPSHDILERVTQFWERSLAAAIKAQEYLRDRKLWHPEILRAFHVGYSSGRMPAALPAAGKLTRQLRGMGLLNKKGNELFYGRLVFPLYDEAGVLVNVYGRAVSARLDVPHLYLPGPRRGVFNGAQIHETRTVILTESVLDALSLIVLGFITQTTASYGVNGFTADHRSALLRAKVQRVYCAYDADPAGDTAADQLAHDLAGHGIEVLRVALPAKDPNDFLKGGGTRDQFQALLDAARPLAAPRPTIPTVAPARPAAAAQGPAAPVTANTAPAPAATAPDGVIAIARGPRSYEVVLLPQDNPLTLRVRLKVRHAGKAFIDTLNLYSDRARVGAVARLARLFGATTKREQIEADLFSLVDELEAHAKRETPVELAPGDAIPDGERATAMAFLTAPDLAGQVRNNLGELGVVGEDRSKLLIYLVATSRKQPKPLSLCVVSRSSGGKSFIVSKTSELMPPEDVLAYTRMSSKALFHDESERLKHKLLTIEEAQGMEEAAYALRVMQSNQMLRNLSTITDPTTGRHKASENIVHGPVALIVTTTTELDFETVSRAFVISVDESVAQTERIHQMQRSLRTLDGLGAKLKAAAITAKHQNAQRLLKPLAVVNPFAPTLTFPSGTLRLRREQEKYLTLIDAITYLFQYQREQGVYTAGDGQTIPYVLTTPADIDLANELVVASLRQAFEEVTTPSRDLLRLIRKMVTDPEVADSLGDSRFSRRSLREYTRWSDYQIRIHLKQLEDLEYVQAVTGSFGKEYVYALSPDHRLALDGDGTLEDEVRELGLTSAADLTKAKKS